MTSSRCQRSQHFGCEAGTLELVVLHLRARSRGQARDATGRVGAKSIGQGETSRLCYIGDDSNGLL